METILSFLDIHTHRDAPAPRALISVEPADFKPIDGQYYSVGIHPWHTADEITEEQWKLFEETCRNPQVLAVGECGVDTLKGGPLFRQMNAMKRQIQLSEELQKPLVIHDVRAHDIIIGMKKDLNPTQPWLVHGFRGKPTVARMLADAGIWISFGPLFTPESVLQTPIEGMLAETDASGRPIEEVITALSALRGHDLTEEIAANSRAFLGLDILGI